MSTPVPTKVTADLCSVTCVGDEVVILFGQRVESGTLPGVQMAQPLQRITMSSGGAAKLQDLLTDLLNAADSASAPKR